MKVKRIRSFRIYGTNVS